MVLTQAMTVFIPLVTALCAVFTSIALSWKTAHHCFLPTDCKQFSVPHCNALQQFCVLHLLLCPALLLAVQQPLHLPRQLDVHIQQSVLQHSTVKYSICSVLTCSASSLAFSLVRLLMVRVACRAQVQAVQISGQDNQPKSLYLLQQSLIVAGQAPHLLCSRGLCSVVGQIFFAIPHLFPETL